MHFQIKSDFDCVLAVTIHQMCEIEVRTGSFPVCDAVYLSDRIYAAFITAQEKDRCTNEYDLNSLGICKEILSKYALNWILSECGVDNFLVKFFKERDMYDDALKAVIIEQEAFDALSKRDRILITTVLEKWDGSCLAVSQDSLIEE